MVLSAGRMVCAVIGILYGMALTVSLLLADKMDDGGTYLGKTLVGSMLWVSWPLVVMNIGVYAALLLFHWVCRSRIIRLTDDPDHDIALAQFAAIGAIAAHVLFGVHGDSMWALASAWCVTLVAAGFYAVVRRASAWIPLEAVIGISYAAAAAGALFLIDKGTGGHTHIQEMLAGSLLWVGWPRIVEAGVVFALVGIAFCLARAPLERVSDDYEGASRKGMRVVGWDFLFYALCGAVITVAVRLSGVLVVFCFLIIPATVSALFSTQWGGRFAIAAGTGAAASLARLPLGYFLDFSAGAAVALALGATLFGAWALAAIRPKHACGEARQ